MLKQRRTWMILPIILLAGCHHNRTKVKPRPVVTPIPQATRVVLPREGVFHSVQRGESIFSICRAYDKSIEAIRLVNGLTKRVALYPGQTLFIPGAKNVIATRTSPTVAAVKKIPVQKYPGVRTAKMISPVKGKILVKFGQKFRGVPSAGMNLAAKDGQGIWAAQDGVVRFLNSNFPGLGGVVLIQHPSGLWSMYGHLSEPLVKVGQKVHQGDVIARAGRSGRVTEPQVHFRLYRNGQTLNPITHLVR